MVKKKSKIRTYAYLTKLRIDRNAFEEKMGKKFTDLEFERFVKGTMDKMIKSKMETPFFDTEVINMGELTDD